MEELLDHREREWPEGRHARGAILDTIECADNSPADGSLALLPGQGGLFREDSTF